MPNRGISFSYSVVTSHLTFELIVNKFENIGNITLNEY